MDTHTYHHNDDQPRVSVKVEKNTKGYNYEASVSNCASVETAKALVDEIMASLERTYGAKAA